MKKLFTLALSAVLLFLAQGCFRQEVQVAEYSVPAMSTPAAGAYIQGRLKGIPGISNSTFNVENRTITVIYQSSTIRTMNIEEAIALSGFAVNNRPANPNAKLPKGLE
ncbi:MAG: heavy-metal-associated domain-containing protein [Verrucomicrobia bacterium]|nr:heavy-metal-associated domain-containing protein [Verrucomicrobiota bacterium]